MVAPYYWSQSLLEYGFITTSQEIVMKTKAERLNEDDESSIALDESLDANDE